MSEQQQQEEEEMWSHISDCAVLELVDGDMNNMYIWYDWYEESYIIRGKTNLIDKYSFNCGNTRDLLNFIYMKFRNYEMIQILFHNYSSLPYSSDEVEYEILNDRKDINAYWGTTLINDFIEKKYFCDIELHLDIIKNFYNNY